VGTPTKENVMTAPATTPDLLGMRLAHRMMRGDLHRLTAVTERVAAGATYSAASRKALVSWVRTLCHEIHHHHTVEDELTWPLIARSAGTAVDLAPLSDDHAALDPLLDEIRAAADELAATGSAGRLAAALARVRDELDEHIETEEAELFPVIERYVPVAGWLEMEKKLRKGGAPLRFVLPRVVETATPDELARITAEAGPVLGMLAGLLRRGHEKRVRLVFG
jgi:iron-sulfur cluster repair protein YtfE (RIC family)